MQASEEIKEDDSFYSVTTHLKAGEFAYLMRKESIVMDAIKARRKAIRNVCILAVFPLFLVLLAEYIQLGSLASLWTFMTSRFNVILYAVAIVSIVFLALLFLIKRPWIAMASSGVLFFLLACVEYFKFSISGSHLLLDDLRMTANLGDIASFAKIHIPFHMVIALGLLLTAVAGVFFLHMKLKIETPKRLISAGICLMLLTGCILPGWFSDGTYRAFGLDVQQAQNSFHLNEKFNHNGFLGFLVQSTSESIDNRVTKPQEYSQEYISSLILKPEAVQEQEKLPSVVFVMSESFADVRTIGAQVKPETYRAYDRAAEKCAVGQAAVPTFGGYTARTEFELLFGLPTEGLNTPTIPHLLLDKKKSQPTVAARFQQLGYQTSYIHPFSRTFYDREEIYSNYGFDNLFFEDNLSVEATHYRRYIDDRTVFAQIQKQLTEEAGPSFIFATTMQNHQPYSDNPDQSELEYYLDGIQHTGEALDKFLTWLDSFDEEVVVVFIGDHFPFFTPQSQTYEQLGIDDDTVEELYYQKYLIYDNGKRADQIIADQTVSAFYLPHLIGEYIGLPRDAFAQTMLHYMHTVPVYTSAVTKGLNLAPLQNLTYDRTLGKGYSILQ